MLTVAANAAVVVWVVLLIFAPVLVFALHRAASPAVVAGGGALTLVILCLVGWIVASQGYGDIVPLRCCAAVLALALAWTVVKAALLLRQHNLRIRSSGVLAVPVGTVLGVWVLVPPLLAIGRSGLTFGLATLGNNDIANYILVAENTAMSGFGDSHHLANSNLGEFARDSYIGATVLINFVSSATGLTTVQATMASMGVAVAVLSVGLWALGAAVWPSARWSVGAGVVIAILAALSAYSTAHYFLGAMLGLAGIATALAGATMLGRNARRTALLAIGAGGSLGIYSYAHLGLPILIGLPVWTALVFRLIGNRGTQSVLRACARAAGGIALALVLAGPTLSEALALVRSQSDVVAGYTLPGLDSISLLVWPGGIGDRRSATAAIGSWLAVLAVLGVALALARRDDAHRSSASIAAVMLLSTCVIIASSTLVYGPDRYQNWKMQSYVLPFAVVTILPVLGIARARIPLTRIALAALTAAVTACPFLVWSTIETRHDQTKIADPTLMRLDITPQLAGVTRLNIRMPSYFETMVAGATFTKGAVVFSNVTYYYPMVSLTTCTLTKRSMLAPSQTQFTDLGDGYVLIDQPAGCR